MQIHVTKDVFNLSEVFTISRGSRTQAEVITVAVEQNNVIGYGECVPYARYHETLESVADQITQVPKDVTRTHLYKLLPAGAARNALDCALWDLSAKTSGKRVWELAGLQQPRPEPTAYTLSLAEPEKMHAQAAKNCFRNLLKIKLGTPDDIPRLEAVRAGAGLINDVRALQESGALQAAAEAKVPVCLMHMQGQPRTMQDNP